MENLTINNRYRILQNLGNGGFSQTFLAEDLHLPTKPQCVVKHLKPQFNDEDSIILARRLFEQEAEVLYRLGKHPHIPNLLAHFEEQGEFYLVQELIEGYTFAQEMEKGKNFDEKEIIVFLQQTLETLAFVHRQNVIHRDIKPSNLIRRYSDGKIFVIDFGAVKQVGANPNSQNPTFHSTITIGSAGYMPSEQTIGKPRFASDLYAVGAVSIELLTGLHPLKLSQNQNTGEFVWEHKTKLSPEIGNFISKLVRYDFRQRHNSAVEAFAALNLIVKSNLKLLNRNSLGVAKPQVSPPLHFVPPPQVFAPPSDITRVPRNNPPIPPTIITNIRQNPPTVVKKEEASWIWKNDFALGALITLAVFAVYFIGGFVLVNLAGTSGEDTSQVYNKENPENLSTQNSQPVNILQEALSQGDEASVKEKSAKTKNQWQEVGNQYKRAADLLDSIGNSSPDYQLAKTKQDYFKQRAQNAFDNAQLAINITPTTPLPSSTSPTTTNYPSTPSLKPTPYPQSTPPLYVPAVMPPPRKEKMYFVYNTTRQNGYGGISKVITAREGDFTSSIGSSGAYSGSVTIRVNGGPDSCDITFIAPHSERLQRGTYSGAQRYPFQSPTKPGLDFSGTGGCNTVAGSFTINDILYGDDGKSIVMLSASFIHRCGETSPPTMGRVHYDARY